MHATPQIAERLRGADGIAVVQASEKPSGLFRGADIAITQLTRCGIMAEWLTRSPAKAVPSGARVRISLMSSFFALLSASTTSFCRRLDAFRPAMDMGFGQDACRTILTRSVPSC